MQLFRLTAPPFRAYTRFLRLRQFAACPFDISLSYFLLALLYVRDVSFVGFGIPAVPALYTGQEFMILQKGDDKIQSQRFPHIIRELPMYYLRASRIAHRKPSDYIRRPLMLNIAASSLKHPLIGYSLPMAVMFGKRHYRSVPTTARLRKKGVPNGHTLLYCIHLMLTRCYFSSTVTRRLYEIGERSFTPPAAFVSMLSRLTPILTNSFATVSARRWLSF